MYKENIKSTMIKCLIKRKLRPREMVLLFNSRLKMFPGKIKSKWSRPFNIKEIKLYRDVNLEGPVSRINWIVRLRASDFKQELIGRQSNLFIFFFFIIFV